MIWKTNKSLVVAGKVIEAGETFEADEAAVSAYVIRGTVEKAKAPPGRRKTST